MKRIIAALFLTGFAAASFAQATSYSDSEDVIVKNGEACPAGYFALVPSYEWQDGHFVRTGELCENLDKNSDSN